MTAYCCQFARNVIELFYIYIYSYIYIYIYSCDLTLKISVNNILHRLDICDPLVSRIISKRHKQLGSKTHIHVRSELPRINVILLSS